MKTRKSIVLILILIVAAIFGLRQYYSSLLSPLNSSNESEKRFVVYQGEGIYEIADRLYQEGLIRSSLAFKIMARNSDLKDKIQAGDFRISPDMSSHQILEHLTVGVVEKWVTLIEGWRVEEMAAKLNISLGVDNDEFIKEAKKYEGYLFPDTYLFSPDSKPAGIAAQMRANFDRKVTDDIKQGMAKVGLTLPQGVILASIVEREARSQEARRMVASILLRRFKIDMGLNADATIQYALGFQRAENGWWKKNLTYDDLKVKSPYNTYIHSGLPPGPICNPSLSSLQAVAQADPKTPYLYYYHDSQGRSYYAKTLEEHNENVATYK